MRHRLLKIAAWLLRKYFVGRRVYRVVSLDGFPSVQDYGKIIGCVHSVKTGKLTVTYLDGRKFPISIDVTRLYRDKNLKGAWAYHD